MVDEKGRLKNKKDKAKRVGNSLHIVKRFNTVLHRFFSKLYQPFFVIEPFVYARLYANNIFGFAFR